MPTIISKIRCNNPNKNSSAMRNHNLLVYIGTREGVDLSDAKLDAQIANISEDQEQTENIIFAESNTKANGLFGNIEISDVNKLANTVASLTRNRKNIYNGIISLREEDASKLEYLDKSSWVNSLNSIMPDIAHEFHIPVTNLNWVAAVHMESGHPHCHYMFWQTNNTIKSPYIHPSVQDRCRMKIAKEFFSAERENAVIEKTLARNASISLTKNELTEISTIINQKTLPARLLNSEREKITNKIQNLITHLPSTGKITYKLLPAESKAIVDDIVSDLLNRTDIKKELQKYYTSIDSISDSYSANNKKKEINRIHAKVDIEKRIANTVLSTAKAIRSESNRIVYEGKKKENQEYQLIQCSSAGCFSLLKNSMNIIESLTQQNKLENAFNHSPKPVKRKKKKLFQDNPRYR